MRIDFTEVSAFSRVPGGGNPAAVVQLSAWLKEATLSQIAILIARPVTSFIVDAEFGPELTWYSKAGIEVQSMCGHGTLAAACVATATYGRSDVVFKTANNIVPVRAEGGHYQLELPRWDAVQIAAAPDLCEALGEEPSEMLDAGRDILAIFPNEQTVRGLTPDMSKLSSLGRRGYIVSAPGTEYDCVSRFFCPAFGIGVDEDPVTGSAHCSIAPFWSKRLLKTSVRAFQASREGGELDCDVLPNSVRIRSAAAIWRTGHVYVDASSALGSSP